MKNQPSCVYFFFLLPPPLVLVTGGRGRAFLYTVAKWRGLGPSCLPATGEGEYFTPVSVRALQASRRSSMSGGTRLVHLSLRALGTTLPRFVWTKSRQNISASMFATRCQSPSFPVVLSRELPKIVNCERERVHSSGEKRDC